MTGTERSLYLGSAWFPALVTLVGAVHYATTQSVAFFEGQTGGFFFGVVTMHLAVAATEGATNRYLHTGTDQ